MKMVRAILRPETADEVADGLAAAGFFSLTKITAFGRGKQKGITVGNIRYDELPKVMLLTVVDDNDVVKVVEAVRSKAYTGSYGDGKVFVSPVEDVVTVRTGKHEL